MKTAARILAGNLAAGLLEPFIYWALVTHPTAEEFWMQMKFSMVYANVIGTLAQTALPALWHCTDTFSRSSIWLFRVSALLAASVAGSFLSVAIFFALGWTARGDLSDQFYGGLKIATLITLTFGCGAMIYHNMRHKLDAATRELRRRETERERALKLATEARLASLESRIHPHFLFNTLNSISALIPVDPEHAERLVERMSRLLRFSLDAGQFGLSGLADELSIVRDYLEIERTRFGDRLRYRIDVPEELRDWRVPPLAIQTLVENSVKYAVSAQRAGAEIAILAHRENGALAIDVADTGPGFALGAVPSGHGIDNLRGRLAALYDGGASMTCMQRDGRFTVSLRVPHTAAETDESVSG